MNAVLRLDGEITCMLARHLLHHKKGTIFDANLFLFIYFFGIVV